MSEFKPMVKMYTDEPSVSLKLKKGGKVHVKHHKEEHGHKGMHHAAGGMMHGAHHAFDAEHGKSPKKPSMHERMKAMNPNFKKGGKVAHKVMGGGMPMQGAPMSPMGANALGQMDPNARAQRAMMVRKALTGMKKGGSADHKHIEKLEKELHHHEKLDMKHAHPMKKASGGAIDKAETRTTIEKGAKKFEKTKVNDGEHHDKHHGTGEIKEGKPAGYRHGGHAKKHKATGGAIPADTHESTNMGKTKFGGTIEDNEGSYLETEMHSAKRDHAHGTGGVAMANAGGFKHGGKAHKMHHKASGGAIDKLETRNTIEGGNWENRSADTAKKGKTHTKTGEVKESNAGGYKHGGHASKKHFATGGNVVDSGKPEKMPHHFISQPVANSLQSGTFKRGGKVHHHAGGGSQHGEYDPDDFHHEYEDSEGRIHSRPKRNESHYSEVAVNKAIASSNRSGRKISGKEGKAIHSLLKGRYAKGGMAKKFDKGGTMEFPSSQDFKDVSPQDVADAKQRAKDSESYNEASRITPRDAGAGRGFKNPPLAKKHGGRAKKC